MTLQYYWGRQQRPKRDITPTDGFGVLIMESSGGIYCLDTAVLLFVYRGLNPSLDNLFVRAQEELSYAKHNLLEDAFIPGVLWLLELC